MTAELRVLFCIGASPDFYAAPADQFKEARIDDSRLWRYAKVEVRIGVPLDFGTE